MAYLVVGWKAEVYISVGSLYDFIRNKDKEYLCMEIGGMHALDVIKEA